MNPPFVITIYLFDSIIIQIVLALLAGLLFIKFVQFLINYTIGFLS